MLSNTMQNDNLVDGLATAMEVGRKDHGQVIFYHIHMYLYVPMGDKIYQRIFTGKSN